jgi:hypothetical protein
MPGKDYQPGGGLTHTAASQSPPEWSPPTTTRADCFAYAALDATSTPSINPVALGRALEAAGAQLAQAGPCP